MLSAQSNITYTGEGKISANSRQVLFHANAGYTTLPVGTKFTGFILYI